MPVQLTTESFRTVVRLSGLVQAEKLVELERRYPLETTSAEAYAGLLSRLELVTEWQAEKLLQAKHQGFRLGEFRLQSLLAKGGMSTIYAARDESTGEECVLKILPKKRVDKASYLPRFQREARIASTLDHPNVVRVFGLHLGTDGKSDIHFMAMERLHGENLMELVEREGPLPLRQAAIIIRQAANGLAYAHNAGLVHRDVKPANFVITTRGVVKVLDLGLASISCDDEADLTRQFDERILGTADYLSPEQAVDSATADARADVYGLGGTLYFLVTGRPPFPDGELATKILAHQMRHPRCVTEFRSDVPPEFLKILTDMQVKDRNQRTQSSRDVDEQLTGWLKSVDGDSKYDETPDITEPPKSDSAVVQANRQTETHTDTHPLNTTLTPAESPADNAEETDDEDAVFNGRYTPEFHDFLEYLDEESGIDTVVKQTRRRQQLRTMSRVRPDDEDDSSDD